MFHDLYNPTETHRAVRDTVRQFASTELEPQAAEFDHTENFNEALFRRLGSELNLFGLTVPEEEGGLGSTQWRR
jgi:isovaleryl-CoA dehydrogenase